MLEIKIQKLGSFEEIDKEKLKGLIESGFCRQLVDDYFEYANPEYICLATDGDGTYLGAIVVEKIPDSNIYYLDKIVVNSQNQRRGIGTKLWEELNGHSRKLMWRAKKDNPHPEFYGKKYHGLLTFPGLSDYLFYYYGLAPSEIPTALEYAINKKPTVIEA